MDNDFERQFTKNVQQTVATQSTPTRPVNNNSPVTTPSSRIPWVIIASLSFVIILQVVALIIVLTKFAPETFEAEPDDIETSNATGSTSSDTNFVYSDDDELLTAFNLNCNANNSNFTFTTDGKYTSSSGSGTYSIVNGNAIILDNNTDRPLYYDGVSVIDGITTYDCDTPDGTE